MNKNIEKFKLVLKHHDKFQVYIKHEECDNVCGLVKGGLTKEPRLYCFNCGSILGKDEVIVKVKEI